MRAAATKTKSKPFAASDLASNCERHFNHLSDSEQGQSYPLSQELRWMCTVPSTHPRKGKGVWVLSTLNKCSEEN